MTIEYQELVDGVPVTRKWRGRKRDAIAAAIEWLGVEYRPYARGWVHYINETGEEIVVTKDDLAIAGAAILAGAKEWESLWCATHGKPLRQRSIKLS